MVGRYSDPGARLWRNYKEQGAKDGDSLMPLLDATTAAGAISGSWNWENRTWPPRRMAVNNRPGPDMCFMTDAVYWKKARALGPARDLHFSQSTRLVKFNAVKHRVVPQPCRSLLGVLPSLPHHTERQLRARP